MEKSATPPTPASTEAIFADAARKFVAAGEFHRLFDLRLVERQAELGLPLGRRVAFDDVDEAVRSQLEAGYLAACREVGELLVEAGRLREAWMYLRPTGDKQSLRAKLARTRPAEDSIDELIEVALFEGVDPERGYAWLIGRQGLCSAITTLDGLQGQLSQSEFRSCVVVLVRQAYGELRGNLRGHLQRLTGEQPPDLSVAELVARFPELTARGDYHLDVSHLSSVVRHARAATDPAVLRKALEMAEYGTRLAADLQYAGDPPFEDVYPAHALYLAASLGERVDEAVGYFSAKAEAPAAFPGDFAAVETLLTLLSRCGDAQAALDAFARLVPQESTLSPFAPTLVELAEQSGAWDRFQEICAARGDAVAATTGKILQSRRQSPG